MRFSCFSLVAWVSAVVAAPWSSDLDGGKSLGKRCINTFLSRDCWGDYDISTNYYEDGPDTGVVREYWFNIVNGTASPDGIERMVMSVNGTVPGPTIYADWGDTIVVHVTNSLENNGTSIHFHGIRQANTTEMDGVTSVTQCPIAPGDSFTYRWKATQYGSSWWHSHYYVQAWDGVFGGIVINGPATANYDEDLGSLFLNDWSHETPDTLLPIAEATGPPPLENGLINGTNIYNNSGTIVGSRFEPTTFITGLSYRLRIINAGADTHFKFTIDNHALQVIAVDFVPIVPYMTNVLNIAMGQRYDVIVTANATLLGQCWMRAIPQISCSNNVNADNIRGIIRYFPSSIDPTTTAWPEANVDECVDEDMANLVPYVALDAFEYDHEDNFDVSVIPQNDRFVWEMGTASFVNQWDYPTLEQVAEGNDTWTAPQRVYEFPDADTWVYWVIQTANTQPHPMHLHGHDFYILGQGTGVYNESTASVSLTNPPRRDVILLPGDGYVLIAFKTDNPGTWVMHCHIAWHTSEGLAVQIVERESEILANVDTDALNATCTAFKSYMAANAIVQDDSGI